MALLGLVLVIVAAPPARLPIGAPGKVCSTDEGCGNQSMLCVKEPEAQAKTCHLRCHASCAESERCTVLEPPDRQEDPISARRFVCTADRDRLCRPCERDDDCLLMLDKCVIQANGEHACGRDCAWDGACPPGFTCGDPAGLKGVVKRQCVPIAGCCNCDQALLYGPSLSDVKGSGPTNAGSAASPSPSGWAPGGFVKQVPPGRPMQPLNQTPWTPPAGSTPQYPSQPTPQPTPPRTVAPTPARPATPPARFQKD